MNEEKTRLRRPKGYSKRTEEQKADDLQFCTRLFLMGYKYADISRMLNCHIMERGDSYTITGASIFYDMKKLLNEWKKESFDNIEEHVKKEVHKLDLMEYELWVAWEASKTGKIRKKSSSRPSRDELKDSYDTNETTTETSPGNPRFLQLILEVMQRRAKLLGFDAPVKIDVTGVSIREEETRVPQYNASDIPDDVLFAVADKLQAGAYVRSIQQKGQQAN